MADAEVDPSQVWRIQDEEDDDEDAEQHVAKWKILRSPVLREPKPFVEVDYSPYRREKDPEQSQTAQGEAQPGEKSSTQGLIGGLREKFQKLGLQVIVKMASIELTPEKPEFPAGGWHIEGQMNER